MRTFPFFRFNPNAEKNGIFTRRVTTCTVCELSTNLVYEGPIASESDVKDICPWCIADGRAAELFEAEFAGSAGTEDIDDNEAFVELLHRTPGFNTFQEITWPVHCDTPCAYIGPVDKKVVKPMRKELIDDIEIIADEFGIEEEELIDGLTTDGSMQGQLFKCVECGQHRLVVDQE